MPATDNEIHQGDYGTAFRLNIKDSDGTVDISGATEMLIYFKKPDGTSTTKTAAFYSDGVDGVMEYIAVDGDIDQAGTWKMQGRVELPSGRWYTEESRFKVHDNLV